MTIGYMHAESLNIYTGAPMYANDLALIATSPEELQGMLDIVQNYGCI